MVTVSPVFTKSVSIVDLPSAFIARLLWVAPFAITAVSLSTTNFNSSAFSLIAIEVGVTSATAPQLDGGSLCAAKGRVGSAIVRGAETWWRGAGSLDPADAGA